MKLTESQIGFLEKNLRERGVTVPSLADDLLDHFCCAIEYQMKKGADFQEAYQIANEEICPDGPREFNLATQLILIQSKYSIMKKFTFIAGFITAAVFLAGWFFKINHWPGANIMVLTGGTIFGLGFLPLYFSLKFRSEKELGTNKPGYTYVLKFLLASYLCLCVPYSILHWPGTQYVIYAAFLLFNFVFLPMVFLNWYRNMNKASVAGSN